MANARVRLSQQTIDAIEVLGQQCGIDDYDTVIKLLIRKYGGQLATLLSPDSPVLVNLSQSVPPPAKPDPIRDKNPATRDNDAPANAFFDMDFDCSDDTEAMKTT